MQKYFIYKTKKEAITKNSLDKKKPTKKTPNKEILVTKKTPKRKRNLRKSTSVSSSDIKNIKTLILAK